MTVEDRALTLDDTQGMFLLLGAGFLIGAASLFSEWFGGCFNLCKRRRSPSSAASIQSNPRSYDNLTPREKLNSISYNCNSRLGSIVDIDPRSDENSTFFNSTSLNSTLLNLDPHNTYANHTASQNNSHLNRSIEEEELATTNLSVHSEKVNNNTLQIREDKRETYLEDEVVREPNNEEGGSEIVNRGGREYELYNIATAIVSEQEDGQNDSSQNNNDKNLNEQNLIDDLFNFHELFGEEVQVEINQSYKELNDADGEVGSLGNK